LKLRTQAKQDYHHTGGTPLPPLEIVYLMNFIPLTARSKPTALARLLALVLVSFLSPADSFAGPLESPCSWLDHEALVALKLDGHKAEAEHKKMSGAAGSPMQNIDICTFTPRNARLPTLTVTATALPKGGRPTKPACHDQLAAGTDFLMCSVIARDSLLSLTLATAHPSDPAMKKTFQSQAERLSR
jgi:hypothetical protein